MQDIRRRIDETDKQLIALFEKRMELVREVGEYKRTHNGTIFDEARERAVLTSRSDMVGNPCNAEYVRSFMMFIMGLSRNEQRRAMNVYLIGMPGSGKSTVGQKLSEITGIDFADTDKMVENDAQCSISELFEREGEIGFRKRERQALICAAQRGHSIVATGGGILTTDENEKTMKTSGCIVFLDRRLEKLINMDMSARPLVNSCLDIEKLYERRYDAYKNAADFTIDPDGANVFEILSDYCRGIRS